MMDRLDRLDRRAVAAWVAGYERAWRQAGTEALADLFTADATYLPSPWSTPISGLDAIASFWEDERDGPDEPFTMTSEVVTVEGNTAVARVEVTYGPDRSRWRDLWVMRFAADGRCEAFEEWPFAPDQRDGHERPDDPEPG